ncbi:VCBS repeat-containing protein, partial [bacterium]|nr:VCBS repeat-containing protein [candidate division CSSED10-310 bacterium]
MRLLIACIAGGIGGIGGFGGIGGVLLGVLWVAGWGGIVQADEMIDIASAIQDTPTVTPTLTPYPTGTWIPAQVVDVAPAPDTLSPASSNLTVTVDDLLDETTVNEFTFRVYSERTGGVPGQLTFEESAFTMDPDLLFLSGDTIKASVTSFIQAGGVPVVPFVWQFRIAAASGHGTVVEGPQAIGAEYTRGFTPGDMDEDGDVDLVSTDQPAKLWLNDGAGNFTNSSANLGPACAEVTLGDLDNDGDLDCFLSRDFNFPDIVLFNNGGTFIQSGQVFPDAATYHTELGDLDGDGDLDAFCSGINGSPSQVWFNDGAGFFAVSPTSYGSGNNQDVELGDLDHDGDLDAFLISSGRNTVLLNDGSGTFTNTGQLFDHRPDTGVDLGDVDNDGDLDAVISAYTGYSTTVWLNDGNGTFTDSGQSLVPPGSIAAADCVFVDLDGDDDLDIFVAANTSNGIFLNDGNGIVTWNGQTLPSSTANLAAVADIDQDGDMDIIVADHDFYGHNRVWLNAYAPPTPTPTSTLTPVPTDTPEATLTPTHTPEPTETPTPCIHNGDTNQDGILSAGDVQLAFQ